MVIEGESNEMPTGLAAGKAIVSSSTRALARNVFTTMGRERAAALRGLRNRHLGERCVIMGNGPSLNNTDLSLLRGETVFGLNRIYLMFDRLGFEPAYHVAVNELVVQQCAAEIDQLSIPMFTTWHNAQYLQRRDIYLLNQLATKRFHTNVAHGVWEGMTVTFVAMQLAYYMGFDHVILIGVDHSFVTQGEANRTVTSTGADPNHFDGSYFGKGFKWQLPDLDGSEMAYALARRAYERAGRRIVDATVEGKLQIFPKVSLETELRRGA